MFQCLITKDNKRQLMVNIWESLTQWLQDNESLLLTITPKKSQRSIEQNKRLWKIYQTLADNVWVNGRQYNAEVWHEYFKREFLTGEEITLPDGTQTKIIRTTTKLKIHEMAEYQEKIQAWGAMEHGITWEF